MCVCHGDNILALVHQRAALGIGTTFAYDVSGQLNEEDGDAAQRERHADGDVD